MPSRARPLPPQAAAALPTGARARNSLAGAALVALALVVYAPLWRAGFIWDDDDYVTANQTLRTPDGLRRIWFERGATHQYYPLVHSSFWIEYHLWGLDPRGYHAVNVLLHAASAILFWRLLERLRVPGGWLAAALFAVHPVMVESVAWVTERKNVLSLTLALGSLLCYFRFAPPERDSDAPQRARLWYGLALVLFLAALLSKTVVATLPAVILVILWWQRGRLSMKVILPLVPFFALGIGLGLNTAWMEKHVVGAAGVDWHFSPADRVLIAGRAVWFYAGKLLWPAPLVFFYPKFPINDRDALQYLYPLAAAALVAALFMWRNKLGRGPLAAVLIFGGVLFPALGFVDVFPFRFSYVADHFQYHAVLALLALLAAAAVTLVEWTRSRGVEQAAFVAAALVVPALGTIAYTRADVFRDVEALYRDTITKNPGGATAYANLAAHLEAIGRLDEALTLAREAARLDPDEASAHNTLGICLVRLAGRSGDASRQVDAGIAHLEQALRLAPRSAAARVNLAMALAGKGDRAAAREQLAVVLEQHPRHVEAHYVLAGVLAGEGDFPAAAEHFRQVVAERPDHVRAWNNLGVVLMNQQQTAAAIDCFAEAARLDPDYPDARDNLAKARQVQRQQPSPAQEKPPQGGNDPPSPGDPP